VEEAPDLDALEPTAEGEPFPGLVSRAVRHRYLAGLAAEGIFPLALNLPEAPRPTLAPPPPQAAAPAPPAPEPVELFPLHSIGEAVEAELWRSEPASEPVPDLPDLPQIEPSAALPQVEEPIFLPEPEPLAAVAPTAHEPEPTAPAAEADTATVTLADLYLGQGHHGEAERIYQEVLRREPDNAAARLGLAASSAASTPSIPSMPSIPDVIGPASFVAEPVLPEPRLGMPAIPATAADFAPADGSGQGGDRRTRTVGLLNRYLQRIRRGSQRDVS